MTGLYIGIGVVAVVFIWVIAAYNGLVRLRQRVREAWSDIEVQLKRRYDLIPNLVEAVKTHNKVAVLNDTSVSPRIVCHALQKGGVKGKRVYLCENLSLENENIKEYDLASLGEAHSDSMNVMIFVSEGCS